MEARRLRTLFRNSTSLSSLLQSLRNFSSSSSSSSSSAAASPRTWKFFSDDPLEVGSSVYRHALKFQRPSTIEWREELRNSVSFIGIVGFPLRKLKCREFGAYTFLNVKTSPNSNTSFRILLKMWNEMAEISIKHLKPNDCIYVSGHLGSYTKDENENLKTCYELIVKEINYVVQPGQGPIEKKYEESDSGEVATAVPLGLGLGALQPKRRSMQPRSLSKGSDATSSAPSQNQQTRTNGQQILQSLANMRNTNSTSSGQLPPALGRIMESVQMGGQGADGQFDAASVMSQVLHSPALNGLLAGVSEQTGVDSSDALRNIFWFYGWRHSALGHGFHAQFVSFLVTKVLYVG
ncbi:hypothetical protein HYC85_008558 [Camellia sinensis]|uniref:OB domain-containing protein n=1 Tax=Camellia sinensis TaxID=4442 RepID=A0A7J7HS62_CAMSI|nr:hypothetical protein HYC85_008558 [Camellia sinensis]